MSRASKVLSAASTLSVASGVSVNVKKEQHAVSASASRCTRSARSRHLRPAPAEPERRGSGIGMFMPGTVSLYLGTDCKPDAHDDTEEVTRKVSGSSGGRHQRSAT